MTMTTPLPRLSSACSTAEIPDGYVVSYSFTPVLSYRILDYWTRCGYLRGTQNPGSGRRRLWRRSEVGVAAAMRRLVDSGLPVSQAADLARRGPCTVPLAQGVGLTLTAELWTTPNLPTSTKEARHAEIRRELGLLSAPVVSVEDGEPK